MKPFKLSIILLVFPFFSTFAQQNPAGFEALILAAKQDSKSLIEGYMSPVLKGINHAVNGGWYHTAKTHKKLGFDISISTSAAFVPAADEIFSISGLNNTTTKSGKTDLPTILGDDRKETLVFKIDGKNDVEVAAPTGIKGDLPFSAVPTPMIQASVGLPFDTDLIVRYLPTVEAKNTKANLLGFGLKHNLLQYLGPIDKLPLNVSLLAAYSKMNIDYDLQKDSSVGGSNQALSFGVSSFTLQALASLNFPIINFYGGIGYASGTTNLDMLGTYAFEYEDAATGAAVAETIKDPVAMEISSSGMRATVGARLSLAFFKIFADYTLQEYNMLSAGVAFSFR